jgi:hypothetical protein
MKFDPDDPNLTAYALGELEGEERAAVEAQVAHSEEARRIVDETRAAAFVLSDELRKEANAWSLEELWRAVVAMRQRALTIRMPHRSQWVRRATLALAALLVVGLSLPLILYKPNGSVPGNGSKPRPDGITFTSIPGANADEPGMGLALAGSQPIGLSADASGVVHAPFVEVARAPISSFPLEARSGGYAAVSRAIAEGRLPSPQSVRIEELVNAFAYKVEPPAGDAALAARVEAAACPWNPKHQLARIAVRTRDQTAATTQPSIVARDARAVVEFNPRRVGSYRLLGFESRMASPEDADHGASLASGQTLTALYEIAPPPSGAAQPAESLRYLSSRQLTPAADSDELLTVRLTHRPAPSAPLRTGEVALRHSTATPDLASEDFRFASAVAALGLVLRDSPNKGAATLDMAISLAQGSLGDDPRRERAQFVELVRQAQKLSKKT